LVMMNYPHNPSGQIATKNWLAELCDLCEHRDIRLFNDNPYYLLSYDLTNSYTLSDIAPTYKHLSWAEAFSASKIISNGTGWRIGAIVGSPDFVGDIAKIKGNTDSGFVAPMAAGVLYAIEHDQEHIEECRYRYVRRVVVLTAILAKYGMKIAVEPRAGFFTLWLRPRMAFGMPINDADQFNSLMIAKTGVVGVPFEPYIRYAVTSDVEAMAGDIKEAFKKAEVSY